MRTLLLSLAAVGMTTAPVAAGAASTTSYVAPSAARASAPAGDSELGSGAGGLFAVALLAGIISIVVIAVVNGEDDDNGNGNGGNLPTSP